MEEINNILRLAGPVISKFTNDVIVVLDKGGKILYINERAIDWIGFTQEELTGKNIMKAGIMPASSVAKSIANLAARFLGKEIPPYSLEFTAKDGHALTSTVKGHLVKDESGKVLADLVLISDIYNKEEYEKALVLEKERTDIYIDLVGTIIVVIDKNENITLLNKKGCEILKTTKEEAIGKNWINNYISEEDREKVKGVFTKVLSGNIEGVETIQNNIIAKDGEKRLISWHNTFLKDKEGNIYATLSSGDDITERITQEEILKKKTEDLERINNLMVGRELKMVELKKEIEKSKAIRDTPKELSLGGGR